MGLDTPNLKQLQFNGCVFFICIMNVSKYTQRKEIFTFLIFNILQSYRRKQFSMGIFLGKEEISITRLKSRFDCKTHPSFASWMPNKNQLTPDRWDELYIIQWIIKCKILFQLSYSGSYPFYLYAEILQNYISWNFCLHPNAPHLSF